MIISDAQVKFMLRLAVLNGRSCDGWTSDEVETKVRRNVSTKDLLSIELKDHLFQYLLSISPKIPPCQKIYLYFSEALVYILPSETEISALNMIDPSNRVARSVSDEVFIGVFNNGNPPNRRSKKRNISSSGCPDRQSAPSITSKDKPAS
jgi:hypothetical protein